jgi:hypothetical protein
LILPAAAGFRLISLDWDGFQHHHPDERHNAWVATTIEFPSPVLANLRTALHPITSNYNPSRRPIGAGSEGIVVLQDRPRDFAYVHVPLYLGVAATRAAETIGPALRPFLPAGWSLTRDVLNGADRVEVDRLTAVGRALTAPVD